MKVLVVDDEPSVRRALRRALESRGHSVCEASDGIEGVQVWRSTHPDLVLLDVLMPGLSGPEVMQELGDTLGAKVILMSAYVGDYDIDRVRQLGASAFEAKPFENIFAVVERAEVIGGKKDSG